MRSALAEAVGKRIQNLRRERQWSQRMLAATLGIDTSKLCKYESGDHLPPHLTLVQMADVFGVSVDSLLGRETGAPAPDDDLTGRLRRVEVLGPAERAAAAGMLDMVLRMHGILAVRARPPRTAGPRAGMVPQDGRLARLLGEMAELETGYRDVAESVLDGVLGLLRYVRDPETPCPEAD